MENSLDGLCRACMCTGQNFHSIIERKYQGLDICEMLCVTLPQLLVLAGDNLPQCICTPCLSKLIIAYHFQQKCVETDICLRKMLTGHKNTSHFTSKTTEVQLSHCVSPLLSKSTTETLNQVENLETVQNEANEVFTIGYIGGGDGFLEEEHGANLLEPKIKIEEESITEPHVNAIPSCLKPTELTDNSCKDIEDAESSCSSRFWGDFPNVEAGINEITNDIQHTIFETEKQNTNFKSKEKKPRSTFSYQPYGKLMQQPTSLDESKNCRKKRKNTSHLWPIDADCMDQIRFPVTFEQQNLPVKFARLIGKHFPNFIPPTTAKTNPTRKCSLCYKTGVRKETRYWCATCRTPLCVVSCFEKYHTIADF